MSLADLKSEMHAAVSNMKNPNLTCLRLSGPRNADPVISWKKKRPIDFDQVNSISSATPPSLFREC